METKATTSSIEVTRNVSTNNEMRLTVGALTVRMWNRQPG